MVPTKVPQLGEFFSAARAERARRIRLLLSSLDDWAEGARVTQRFHGSSGEVPSSRASCGRCGGSGRWARRRCSVCSGVGSVLVDAYTGKRDHDAERDVRPLALQVREWLAEDGSSVESRRARERVFVLALDEPPARRGEWWERARRGQWAHGSYAALVRNLSALVPLDRAAVLAVYGPSGSFRRPGPRLQARADAAVGELERVMPNEIRVPDWLLLSSSRDERIVELLDRGERQASIARLVGVSEATVSRVCKRCVPAATLRAGRHAS